ncbi:MAG: NlpC/P60 family protein [Pontibacterium sp.]
MNTKLEMGYLLYRTKGVVQHAAVYLGNHKVLHNSPSGGVEIISYEEYAQDKEVKVVKTDHLNCEALKARLVLIFEQDLTYSKYLNNCEHIATLLIEGRKYSPQLRAAIISAILVGGLSLKTGKGNPLLLAGVGAIAGLFLVNTLREYDATIPAIKNAN